MNVNTLLRLCRLSQDPCQLLSPNSRRILISMRLQFAPALSSRFLARQKPFAHHFLFLLWRNRDKYAKTQNSSCLRSPLSRGPAHSRTVRWTRDLQYVSRIVSSVTVIAKHRFFSCFVHNKIRIDAPHHALTNPFRSRQTLHFFSHCPWDPMCLVFKKNNMGNLLVPSCAVAIFLRPHSKSRRPVVNPSWV